MGYSAKIKVYGHEIKNNYIAKPKVYDEIGLAKKSNRLTAFLDSSFTVASISRFRSFIIPTSSRW